MKRNLLLGLGLFLVISMAGCCYHPAYISPSSGLPYGGSWEATPGGPFDPVWFTGAPNAPYPTASPHMNSPHMNSPYVNSQYLNNQFEVGRQPVLPMNPLTSFLYWNPLNWLFCWGPHYGAYPGVVGSDCCGTCDTPYGGMYETVPNTYVIPSESHKPEPAPAAEDDEGEPAEAAPTSYNAPALLPR